MFFIAIIISVITYIIIDHIIKKNKEDDDEIQKYYNQTITESINKEIPKLIPEPKLIFEYIEEEEEEEEDEEESKSLTFKCAGFQYHDANKVNRFKLRDKVLLQIDNDNKYDKNAVKIIYNGYFIGYVPHYNAVEVREIIETSQSYFPTIYSYNPRREPYDKLEINICYFPLLNQ